MLGSETLDIAIGLVLVFLLVSLILTSLQEILERFQKVRAKELEVAIFELLQGDTAATGRFYQHPLIQAFYVGQHSASSGHVGLGASDPSRGAQPAPASRQPSFRLPSYIPRDVFSIVLMDLIKTRDGDSAGKLDQVWAAFERVTGGQPQEMRYRIEQWFDGAMDRAAGRYKRHTQTHLLVLGLASALVFNINAVTIGEFLARSPQARENSAKLASRLIDQGQPIAADQCRGTVRPTDNARAIEGTGTVAESLPPSEKSGASPAPDAPLNAATLNFNACDLQKEIVKVGLPVGWTPETRALMAERLPNVVWSSERAGFWATITLWSGWLLLLAGWLITAFAAALGAPFWFDVLNKLMVIRATVKPKEKSGDEASEDRLRSAKPGGNVQPGTGGPVPDANHDDGAVG
jgi:hypothetical protein